MGAFFFSGPRMRFQIPPSARPGILPHGASRRCLGLLLVLLSLCLRLTGADLPACDLTGQPVDPLLGTPGNTVILIFVSTDCPISNRYAPAVNDLVRLFASPTRQFYAIYPEPATTPAAVRQHRAEYGYALPALLDPGHALVRRAGATVTPEATVFHLPPEAGASPRLVYRGRIDNRHENIGRTRPEATEHDLREVLVAIAGGTTPPARTTRAVGCYIE